MRKGQQQQQQQQQKQKQKQQQHRCGASGAVNSALSRGPLGKRNTR
jgi:hypothetical protein